ncbi:MAG: PhnD/SsuA/transferrin family substrate-binding protein [bacterium]|nr:PhnD/SsuA/transferrin family substrate-binding protein [bacterium]
MHFKLRAEYFYAMTGLLAIIWIMLPSDARGNTEQEIRLGVLAFRGETACLNRWGPTADYLSSKQTEYRFRIIPLTLEQMDDAIRNETIDFAFTNPGNYISLETKYGITRIATLKSPDDVHAGNVFGAVIFSRSDNISINGIQDLKNKSFMVVSKSAFGGFQMAWRVLKNSGIDPFEDFKSLSYAGFPQDKIVFAVRDEAVDAGTVRTGVLESLHRDGKINLADYRILARTHHPGFSDLSSTALYPQWPLSKLKTTSNELSQKVVIDLLSMSSENLAARKGWYGGWTVPLTYQPVHALFRELNIGPYAREENISFLTILYRYRVWFSMIATALALSFGWALWTKRLVTTRTRELRQANDDLVDQMAMRQRLEEQVAKRQNELTRVARQNSLGEMASSIAHELNHPLTTILNYVKGCTRRMDAGNCNHSDIQNVLTQVSQQAQHSANVIKVMMDFVRDDVREQEQIDLNDIVWEATELVRLETDNRSIVLEIDALPNVLNVKVDKVQIEQVILNLVRNAIEAVPQTSQFPGCITIRTSLEKNAIARVTIVDNGVGVPARIKEDMFTPFVTEKSGGLGLGLSISRSILEAHKGQLQLIKTSDKGSEISFILPTV